MSDVLRKVEIDELKEVIRNDVFNARIHGKCTPYPERSSAMQKVGENFADALVASGMFVRDDTTINSPGVRGENNF